VVVLSATLSPLVCQGSRAISYARHGYDHGSAWPYPCEISRQQDRSRCHLLDLAPVLRFGGRGQRRLAHAKKMRVQFLADVDERLRVRSACSASRSSALASHMHEQVAEAEAVEDQLIAAGRPMGPRPSAAALRTSATVSSRTTTAVTDRRRSSDERLVARMA
jgi:hypothetical protein